MAVLTDSSSGTVTYRQCNVSFVVDVVITALIVTTALLAARLLAKRNGEVALRLPLMQGAVEGATDCSALTDEVEKGGVF